MFHCTECPDFDYCFMCICTVEETHAHSAFEAAEFPYYPNEKKRASRPKRTPGNSAVQLDTVTQGRDLLESTEAKEEVVAGGEASVLSSD